MRLFFVFIPESNESDQLADFVPVVCICGTLTNAARVRYQCVRRTHWYLTLRNGRLCGIVRAGCAGMS